MSGAAARQAASRVLMVRPTAFGPNPETAASNVFQRPLGDADAAAVHAAAVREHEALAAALRGHGVDVLVVDDTEAPVTPDAVFPNNWVSFHAGGEAILYPMAYASRAAEVREDVIAAVEHRFRARWRRVDLTGCRAAGAVLEGTGSLVLDRVHGRAFAALSPRTSETLAVEVAELLGLRPVIFEARDAAGRPIYHTNVILAIGTPVAVVCGESLAPGDRDGVMAELARGRELIDIDLDQAARFAGNVLELRGAGGAPLLAMSTSARDAFRPEQRARLEAQATIVHVPVPVLERHGGGSVRCALVEVFPPGR